MRESDAQRGELDFSDRDKVFLPWRYKNSPPGVFLICKFFQLVKKEMKLADL